MRKVYEWFQIRYKGLGIFKTCHHLAADKDSAERWGESKFGKIYGVQKVSRDDLLKLDEDKYNRMIMNQQPLGLKITKTTYDSDIDLTVMLFGKPKKDVREKKVEKLSKWDLIAEKELT